MIVEILNNNYTIYLAKPLNIIEGAEYLDVEYVPVELATNQRKNGFIFINGIVTDEIIELTPEEIAEQQEQEKANFVRVFMQKKAKDGQNYASEIRFRITKELIGKPIAEVNEIDSQCQTTIMPLLQLIEGVGADWWSAMNIALATTDPTNAIALAYFNEVKDYIVNYVQTNYPTDL